MVAADDLISCLRTGRERDVTMTSLKSVLSNEHRRKSDYVYDFYKSLRYKVTKCNTVGTIHESTKFSYHTGRVVE